MGILDLVDGKMATKEQVRVITKIQPDDDLVDVINQVVLLLNKSFQLVKSFPPELWCKR